MHIATLEEIKKEFPELRNVNKIHRSKLSPLEKLGLTVTEKVGTMGFFFIILAWTVLWLGWNMLAPLKLRFDPYPAFVLWLFISNLIQIHLMPLIMVGQNIQAQHSELRTKYDYETDKKAEKAIETILLHLESQHKLMEQLLDRVEKLEQKK